MQLASVVSRNAPEVTKALEGSVMSYVGAPEETFSATVKQVPPERKPEAPMVLYPKAAIDVRLVDWLGSWPHWIHGFFVNAKCSGVIQALADIMLYASIWPGRKYKMLRQFVLVMMSGKVSAAEKLARDKICDGCSSNFKRIVVPKSGEPYTVGYCSLCQCPEWKASRLENKNWREGWHCPRRKHPGKYEDDAWRHLIPADQLAGGCKGCGGK